MDAIVLAGGYATRLWPITRDRPKMFLPVGESTVIDRTLEDLESDSAIEDVYISTNRKFEGDFRSFLDEREYEKPVLSIESTTGEDEKFGVVSAIAELIDREGLDDDTLVVAGDNLISFSLSEFVDEFRANDATTVAAYDVGDLDRATQYGVIDIDGDQVMEFQEKPEEPPSTLVSIACYAFPAGVIDEFETYLAEGNNPDEPGWFVQWLVDREDVYAYPFDDAWYDIGTPESYLDAAAWQLDGGTIVAPSATVENSDIGENVHIMEGATVKDTSLERCVIFPDVTLDSCQIRSTIVDQETHLDGISLSNAQIGAFTALEQGPPTAWKWQQYRDSQ
ncbi:NTP transferase domain-containing protein [Halapricum sp. CBA1109]|uniref:sugar phosphate nucleotidyltransferase n=1 Tax=Halapricum sp. CBA1109 TaxID=2668068 RepID=UPI0012FCBE46|nr:NDP-sugar synthase [Halapricum sp. CBA1109]MUV88580.1 NTP transferase domain-containing protein [Halapricum sp. CBA1109]